jgi:hypothetical protein
MKSQVGYCIHIGITYWTPGPGASNKSGRLLAEMTDLKKKTVMEFPVIFLNNLLLLDCRKSVFFSFKIFILHTPRTLLPRAATSLPLT